MLSRSALGRQTQRALRQQWQTPIGKRGLAAPASGSFNYETGNASGLAYASRDVPGAVTNLAVVAQAGTRFETLPGLTLGLQSYMFKSTQRRSTLRMQRESELLGSELFATHSRDNLVVGARFLRDDLPYFVELLSEVLTQTKFQDHVYHEEIDPMIKLLQKKFLGDVKQMANNSAHSLAFHRGLGVPLYPSSSTPLTKYLDAQTISEYAASAFAKSNIAIVANGAEPVELSKWVGEFFSSAPFQSGSKLQKTQSKYYGGEERIAHASGNAMVIAFPGSSSFTGGFYKPEISVLAALLGGKSSIKWSPGFSLLSKASDKYHGASIESRSEIYSDAGLLTIALTGSAKDIRGAAGEVVKTIESVASGAGKEDFQKAKALAKFKELENGQNVSAALELTGAGLVHGDKAYQIDEVAKAIDGVTEEQVKKAAKTLLENKASVSAVGDLYVLPYAEEIGLKI